MLTFAVLVALLKNNTLLLLYLSLLLYLLLKIVFILKWQMFLMCIC